MLHPQIPKPLHGIAPRVIKGKTWWDTQRKKAYARNDFRCWACGIKKGEAKYHKWLEGHEFYHIDYAAGTMELVEIVALCHLCHNFIHLGRLEHLLRDEEITQDFFDEVVDHGVRVTGDLRPTPLPRKCAAWEDWRLIVDGEAYGPSTPNFESWKRGEWRDWSPPQRR